jgi:RimJ/RimL family protein N-acetyltransferase
VSPYPTFETERLVIRPTTSDDALLLIALYNSPKWLKYIGRRDVHTITQAEAYIAEHMTPQLERLGFSNNTLVRKSDSEKIGVCGFYDREGVDGVDIGFALLPQFEGQGYAFESATRLIELAANEWGIEQISAVTIEENLQSRRLLEKLGLQFMKTINLPGDDATLMLYRLPLGEVRQ